jgi:predicted DNA-binding transcriptional regulator YafY
MSPEKHLPIQRSLTLLRRLKERSANRATLMAWVEDELGAVYPEPTGDGARRAFEEDIRRLRDLGVDLGFERKEGVYVLSSYGEFNPVALGEAELDALAFLLETFTPGAPNHASVQQLLCTVADWLPSNQRASLDLRQQRLRLDLRRRDNAPITPQVEAAVERALRTGRLLRFAYRSPSRTDGLTPVHTVEPWQQVFDPLRGHLYLDAFWLESASPRGRFNQQKWQKFRLDAMVSEQIEVLPTKRNPTPPPRPRHPLEYLLSPLIARYGRVTRHFEQMQVHETDDEGWVRVTATTSDLFQATRLLLTYGPNCQVLGGPEARKEMERLVRGLGEVYGVGSSVEGSARKD